MDSTPDKNHQEQISIVIRIVLMNSEKSEDPSIKEYFLTFINVHSTTGLNLSNILINQLNEYNLKLSNCRGQSYDNGANMVGLYKGVQSMIIVIVLLCLIFCLYFYFLIFLILYLYNCF